jgi:hypothetical protein
MALLAVFHSFLELHAGSAVCIRSNIPRGSSIKLWEIAERDQLIERSAPTTGIRGDDVVINRRRRSI